MKVLNPASDTIMLQQVSLLAAAGSAAIVLQPRVPQITLRDSVFDTILLASYHYC